MKTFMGEKRNLLVNEINFGVARIKKKPFPPPNIKASLVVFMDAPVENVRMTPTS